jgi:phosphatidate cytidylyltransferase
MFFQRLITTCVLIPFVLFCIFGAPLWFSGGVLLLILLLIGRESLALIPLHTYQSQLLFVALLALSIWACGQGFIVWQLVGVGLWFLIILAIGTYPTSASYWGYKSVVGLCFLLLIPLFVQSLVRLYLLPQGPWLLLYLLCLVWTADIGAYLVGKLWGKHKFIPTVSPGKSWEGLIGALVLSLGLSGVGFVYFEKYPLGLWLMLAVLTVLFSVVGDLFISLLKRRCHLKDTGNLLPGHGGILDRMDSLIAAASIFYVGLTYLI